MKRILTLVFLLAVIFSFSLTAHAAAPQYIDKALTLVADTNWIGDYLVDEDVNLNGFTLTVSGNLILMDNSINVNNGKLIVTGDFRIQTLEKSKRSLDYIQLLATDFMACQGMLKMDNVKDYVLVEGNFYPNGAHNVLRAGILELKGNLENESGAYNDCINAEGTHKTIFSGAKDQKIIIKRGRLNILSVNKISGRLSFDTPIEFSSIDEDTDIPVGGNGYIHLFMSPGNTLSLNGHKLNIDGSLVLERGNLDLAGGSLIVRNDFRIQSIKSTVKDAGLNYSQMTEEDFIFCGGILKMDNAKDYILVQGNFYPNGKDNILRNGIIELKGNFMYTTRAYTDCYRSIGNHKTIFSGSGEQRIFFSRTGSQFNILGVNKKSGKLVFESSIDIACIDEDTTIPVGGNGYLYLCLYTNKTFSLKGHQLNIDGTLFLDRGEINIDGGSLNVKKDLRLQSIKSLSDKIKLNLSQLSMEDFGRTTTNVQLTMKNSKDYMLVEGNCIINSSDEQLGLRSGVMEFKGNFSQIGGMGGQFIGYGTHKVILSGIDKQTVSFEAPSYLDKKGKLRALNHFNILQIENKDVIFATKYWANKLIPFVLNVNLNGKAIKFKKYTPIIVNGIIYFEVSETCKLLDIKLTYNKKVSVATGKYGNINISVKGIISNKLKYIQAELLLKKMNIKFNYDPAKKTLFIDK